MSDIAAEQIRDPGLRAAVKAKGTLAALARAIGINRQGIYGWKKVPAERVPAVEAATGVPRHVLRPDIYRKEHK